MAPVLGHECLGRAPRPRKGERPEGRTGAGRACGPGVPPEVWLRKVPGRQSMHSKQQGWRPTGFFFCPGWQLLEHIDTGTWVGGRQETLSVSRSRAPPLPVLPQLQGGKLAPVGEGQVPGLPLALDRHRHALSFAQQRPNLPSSGDSIQLLRWRPPEVAE